jgi:hypothetical protein
MALLFVEKRRMATSFWSRRHRVGAMAFEVTVKRVSPKVFAPAGDLFGQNLILQSDTVWVFCANFCGFVQMPKFSIVNVYEACRGVRMYEETYSSFSSQVPLTTQPPFRVPAKKHFAQVSAPGKLIRCPNHFPERFGPKNRKALAVRVRQRRC